MIHQLLVKRMSAKVALVTGSNKGIGYEIIRQLCRKWDGNVILCSRNESRGKFAVEQLQSEGLQPQLCCLAIDQPDSVTAARDFIVKQFGGLDILVNNAGISFLKEKEPEIEVARETLAVNLFATMNVCDVMFPILRPGARVVNISSSAGMLRRISSSDLRQRISSPSLTVKDIKDLAEEYIIDVENGVAVSKGWTAGIPPYYYPSYIVSKVLLSALTWAQHRQLLQDDRKDIVINAVHPGYVDTDMTEHKGILTPEQGAQAAVSCCLIPPNGQPRGQMVWFDGQVVDWINDDIKSTSPAPIKSSN